MRTLAIDLGTKRVGLALSDEGGKFATPFDVLTISDPNQAATQITEILKDEHIQQIVVGAPLNMDGSLGPAAQCAIDWGKNLSRLTNIPTIFVDERLSSFAAEQQLVDRKRGGEKITRGQKKQRLDALAAASFLQDYLDGKLQALSV